MASDTTGAGLDPLTDSFHIIIIHCVAHFNLQLLDLF